MSGEQQADVSIKALRTAQSYIHVGVYEFALLLLAIAVEVATSRFVYSALEAKGALPRKDPSFYNMLHKQVTALAPAGCKPEAMLVGKVDQIRRLRNELMHTGQCDVTYLQITDLTAAAKAYVEYLSALRVKLAR